ncbi:oligosaccharide flippase family protein, partial [Ruminococcus sp. CAG:379]|uniref:oligosaccharide flippase family protein n=1 Tax=Ruminococcus sp. CAG:379 TaxID=1262956 RepID=UPI00258E0B53
MSKGSVGRDTCFLSVMQLLLQALGLMLNVFLTRRIGPSQVGVVTLISAFFGLCAVLASGNGFVSTSRFVSEEIGRSCGNPEHVLRYAGICSLLLSLLVGGSVYVLAPWLAERFLKSAALASGVRLLAVTLPFASICACLKGYFHARRRVTIPAAA